MLKMKSIIVGIVAFVFLCSACQQEKAPSDPDKKLVVAVAANAQFAMEEIKKAFEKSSDAKMELVVGSSGKLTAQIMQGAPYDVFVSADMNYPDSLYQAGLVTSAPIPYAYGVLVMWTCKGVDLSEGIRTVGSDAVQKIAIANPKMAPYGEEALRVISNFQQYNIDVDSKIVYGESIAQVNQYITSGACDIGFTAKSVVMAPEMKGKGTWVELNPIAYHQIPQGVVITKYGTGRHPKSCEAFMNVLLGDKGRAILADYGYQLPDEKKMPSE